MKAVRKFQIVSLHDFEKVDLLVNLSEKHLLSDQDREHLIIIADRFQEILSKIVEKEFE